MMNTEQLLGARVLSPTMMKCTFQHTDAVLETIELIRKTAGESQDAFGKQLVQSPNEALLTAHSYNNAISILGSRGAGKTSVIMTLQSILRIGKDAWEKGNNAGGESNDSYTKKNIIMPILVPQDFTSGQSLLSWVIMSLCQMGEEIEKEIDRECISFFAPANPLNKWIADKKKTHASDPLRECMDKLIRSFELRYRFDTKRGGSESDHVYKYMDEVKYDSMISLEMLKLVSIMADYYRNRISQTHTTDVCAPLFFFAIDDLDLAPDRSQEVLSLILRYLQHPNIVVLCGWNQELFQSHLTVSLLNNQGTLNSNLLDTNLGYDDVFMKRQRKRVAVLDSARRLAVDNIKKAFPPSQRYEIRGLATKQRASFPFDTIIEADDKDKDQSLFPWIDQTLALGKKQSDASFLRNYSDDSMFIYMRIFDNKARGLINIYRAFLSLKSVLAQWDRESSLDLTIEVRSLIDTILYSNTHFIPYLRGLRDLIKIEKLLLSNDDTDTECNFYCNYKGINSVLDAYQKRMESVSEYQLEREYNYFPSLTIDVYILLNFVENMMLRLSGKPRYEHGGIVFSRALNTINRPINTELDTDSVLSLSLAAGAVEYFELFPSTDNFRINLLLLDYYEKEGFSDRNYDFSGMYGFRRLMRAANKLVTSTPTGSKEDWFFTNEPEWAKSIIRLFEALCFSEENVIRLSKYRSFLQQNLFENKTALLIASNDTDTNDFNELTENREKYSINIVSDVLFEDIIICIRQTDSLKQSFKSILGMSENEVNTSRNRPKTESFTRYCKITSQAESFMRYCKITSQLDSSIIEKYKIEMDSVRRLKDTGMSESNKSIVKEAYEVADSNIRILLDYLKKSLFSAFLSGYGEKDPDTVKFEYLMDVSKAVSYYKDRWNLGSNSWSTKENKAVLSLVTLLQKMPLQHLTRTVFEIERLGVDIAKKGRNTYIEQVEFLEQLIRNNFNLFSAAEQRELTKNMKILSSLPQRVQRDMECESVLLETLAEMGKIIAQGCGAIGLKSDVLADKGSDERRKTSWPITKKDREEISNLAEPFILQSEKEKGKKKNTTQFSRQQS